MHFGFRLCQDIVLLKAEVAELLLPNVFMNLAGRKDMPFDLHQLISMQVLLMNNFFPLLLLLELPIIYDLCFALFCAIFNSVYNFSFICICYRDTIFHGIYIIRRVHS